MLGKYTARPGRTSDCQKAAPLPAATALISLWMGNPNSIVKVKGAAQQPEAKTPFRSSSAQ